MHSPVSIGTEPCGSLALLTSSIPFAFLSITHPLWDHSEWIHNHPFDTHIQKLKRPSQLPDRWFILLCLRKWIIQSLIMERNRISVTLKIERPRLWAFPFLHLTIRVNERTRLPSAFVKKSAFLWCLGSPDETHRPTLSLSSTLLRATCLYGENINVVLLDGLKAREACVFR